MREESFTKKAIDGMHFEPTTFDRKVGHTIRVATTTGDAWAELVTAKLIDPRTSVIILNVPDDAGELLEDQPEIPACHVEIRDYNG